MHDFLFIARCPHDGVVKVFATIPATSQEQPPLFCPLCGKRFAAGPLMIKRLSADEDFEVDRFALRLRGVESYHDLFSDQ